MQAAFMYDKEDIRLEEVAIPEIGDNEVLVQTAGASICGTDLRMFKNGYKNISPENPLILGHELSGTIVDVGKNLVKRYKTGQRVAVAPNMGCGVCNICVSGNTHLCTEYKALGINLNGGFAEYFRVPEAAVRQGNISLIPDHLSFDVASLAEPLSCVYNGFERWEITPGDTVLIMGSGPIGLMQAMMAKMAGAGKIFVNDLNPHRLEEVRRFDKAFVTLSSEHLKEKIFDLTNGWGVDICVTANPSPQAQILAIQLMAINGRVNYFGGVPAGADMSGLDTNAIHYRQLKVTGTTRQSIIQFRKTLNLIADGLIDVEKLITHRHKLERINQAFSQALNREGIKHVISFG
jgi:L-iditol 2-dehydrogenase